MTERNLSRHYTARKMNALDYLIEFADSNPPAIAFELPDDSGGKGNSNPRSITSRSRNHPKRLSRNADPVDEAKWALNPPSTTMLSSHRPGTCHYGGFDMYFMYDPVRRNLGQSNEQIQPKTIDETNCEESNQYCHFTYNRPRTTYYAFDYNTTTPYEELYHHQPKNFLCCPPQVHNIPETSSYNAPPSSIMSVQDRSGDINGGYTSCYYQENSTMVRNTRRE